ncbi:MAG: hypothetical protein ACLUAR_10940 [Pilosibacter sp.]
MQWIDPKQDGETYPYHEICGAVVAWKLINVIYEDLGIPEHEWMELHGVCGHCDRGRCHEAAG